MRKSFYIVGRGFFQDDSTPMYSALNDVMRIEMLSTICYGLHSPQISAQLNSYERFCNDVLDSDGVLCLHDNYFGNIFGNIRKNSVLPSSTLPETYRSSRSCSVGLLWPNTLLIHIVLLFRLNCHPSVLFLFIWSWNTAI